MLGNMSRAKNKFSLLYVHVLKSSNRSRNFFKKLVSQGFSIRFKKSFALKIPENVIYIFAKNLVIANQRRQFLNFFGYTNFVKYVHEKNGL